MAPGNTVIRVLPVPGARSDAPRAGVTPGRLRTGGRGRGPRGRSRSSRAVVPPGSPLEASSLESPSMVPAARGCVPVAEGRRLRGSGVHRPDGAGEHRDSSTPGPRRPLRCAPRRGHPRPPAHRRAAARPPRAVESRRRGARISPRSELARVAFGPASASRREARRDELPAGAPGHERARARCSPAQNGCARPCPRTAARRGATSTPAAPRTRRRRRPRRAAPKATQAGRAVAAGWLPG